MLWKLKLAARVLADRKVGRTLIRHRVMAGIEHYPALRSADYATIIDVGANKGQFAVAARAIHEDARIIAFEPLPDAGATFRAIFANDRNVTLHPFAIGEATGEQTFYVTDSVDSSSLLRPGVGQAKAFGVREARQIKVRVARFADLVTLEALPRPILLKIDVQGGELDVLRSAGDLSFVDAVYVELSTSELYEGQALYPEVQAFLTERGFELATKSNVAVTEAFGETQFDALYLRSDRPAVSDR
jgi:FkbM family methyltransferase